MKVVVLMLSSLWLAALAAGQDVPRAPTRPIYKVMVIERSITAINYGHREEPTKIDFMGTVLSPKSHGQATVESGKGVVAIHAKFAHLEAPSRYGTQFLTYVLWAITPDGRAINLGEVVTNSRNNGKLDVTTQLQSFGLMVTAEPYYSVTVPSDLVAMENKVRPDTIGTVEHVEAKYELLPRGGAYTLNIAGPESSPAAEGPMVSSSEYSALLAIYEAQNAVWIARSQGADVYAPDVLENAQQLLSQAQSMNTQKGAKKQIITMAREAAQRAEDARLVAVEKKAAEQLAAKPAE